MLSVRNPGKDSVQTNGQISNADDAPWIRAVYGAQNADHGQGVPCFGRDCRSSVPVRLWLADLFGLRWVVSAIRTAYGMVTFEKLDRDARAEHSIRGLLGALRRRVPGGRTSFLRLPLSDVHDDLCRSRSQGILV